MMIDASILRLYIFGIIAFVGIIPTLYLYRYYISTKILDYFLMGSAFLCSLLQVLVIILIAIHPQTLLLYQLNDFLYSTFVILFLIHGARLKWQHPPIFLVVVSTIWYLVVTIPIVFYRMVRLPHHGWVGFLYLRNISILDMAPMCSMFGIYIIGRGFEFYVHAFRVFAIIVIFYAYFDTRTIAEALKVSKSRLIFLVSIVSAGIFPIVAMGEMLRLWTIFRGFEWHLFDLITYVGMFYISVRFPETLLISKTQLIRILSIQKDYDDKNTPLNPRNEDDMTEDEVQDYIDLVRKSFPELFRTGKEQT